jgi:uncharacterized protein (UPF0333 family)
MIIVIVLLIIIIILIFCSSFSIKKGDQSLFIQLYNDRKRLRLFEAVQSHKTLRSDCVFVLDTVSIVMFLKKAHLLID